MTTHRREILTAKQWFSNGSGVAFVTSVNYHDEKLYDWAMYVGGQEDASEEELRIWVAKHGCKVSANLARRIAPYLPIKRYRE